jgi:hypothetical protein
VNGYDDSVARLHELLTEALERTRARPYETPVTVAEIYQEIVPYRAVRSEAGFGMNADYEDALLRLLAGENDLARLEPDHARDEILRELRTVNPNVTIYRSYAGCDVWIRPRDDASGSRRSPAAAEPKARETSAGPGEGVGPDRRPSGVTEHSRRQVQPSPASQASQATQASQASHASQRSQRSQASKPSHASQSSQSSSAQAPAGESAVEASTSAAGGAQWRVCAACTGALPRDRSVRFCPACGAHQVSTPCRDCGGILEPGWRYCVDCGADARPAARDSA